MHAFPVNESSITVKYHGLPVIHVPFMFIVTRLVDSVFQSFCTISNVINNISNVIKKVDLLSEKVRNPGFFLVQVSSSKI